jgi:hypothetical protein
MTESTYRVEWRGSSECDWVAGEPCSLSQARQAVSEPTTLEWRIVNVETNTVWDEEQTDA